MNKIAKFIKVLFEILESQEFLQIIRWSNDGNSFIIPQRHQFQTKVMPLYFNTKNINSFFRQLGTYGFQMTKNEKNQKLYWNPCFCRNNSINFYKIVSKRGRKLKKEQYCFQHADFKNELIILSNHQKNICQQLQLQRQIQQLLTQKFSMMINKFKDIVEPQFLLNFYTFLDGIKTCPQDKIHNAIQFFLEFSNSETPHFEVHYSPKPFFLK